MLGKKGKGKAVSVSDTEVFDVQAVEEVVIADVISKRVVKLKNGNIVIAEYKDEVCLNYEVSDIERHATQVEIDALNEEINKDN